MRTDLLQALANHLRHNVKEESFGLENWKCGTTACAIGHAVNVPEIAAEGLTLIVEKNRYDGTLCYPELKGKSGWYAIENLFQITENTANHLFYHRSYPADARSAVDVANRIEEYIQGKL